MRRTLMIVAAAGLFLAAAPATSATASSARPPLRGTNWVLTDRVSLGTPLDGVAVNAVFAAKHVSGTSGCNGYTSSYTTNGSRMTITNDGVSTLIACERRGRQGGAQVPLRARPRGSLANHGDDAHALDARGSSPPRVPGVGRAGRRSAARGT